MRFAETSKKTFCGPGRAGQGGSFEQQLPRGNCGQLFAVYGAEIC